MEIYNNDNTRLIELMEGLSNGLAINQTFRTNHYEFYKENNNILVRLDGKIIGHLEQIPYGTYEQLRFDNWDKMETFIIEWLDELDAYLFEYEV